MHVGLDSLALKMKKMFGQVMLMLDSPLKNVGREESGSSGTMEAKLKSHVVGENLVHPQTILR